MDPRDHAEARAQRPSPGVGAAVVATLAGWMLTSFGVGLGVSRWGTGAVPAGVVAAVAAACGLALLAVAVWAIVRRTRRWGRLLLLPWLIVVAVLVYALTIAVAATFAHVPPEADAVPEGAEEVVMTVDGVDLAAWYFPSENGAAVVLRHGAGSTRADALDHARVLADAGYGVLVTDARGHGDSGGRAMEFGWHGEADIRAALDHLGSREEVDPERIGVVGLSMGGEEAIGAAGADERIGAVVAEGATGRTREDKLWLADEYGAAGVLQNGLDLATYGFVRLLTDAEPPPSLEESVRAADKAPMLLIAAGGVPDEGMVAERLQAVAPNRIDVWAAADAGHVGALSEDADLWRDTVVGFLDAALAAPGAEQ